MQHLSHSFFISTRDVEPELDGCRKVKVAGYHLGAFAGERLPPEGLDRLTVSFETATTERGVHHAQNTAVIEGDTLTVHGSDMNTQSIYYVVTKDRQVLIFNDLFLARYLLEASGHEPLYDVRARADDLTFFAQVSRLGAGEQLTVKLDRSAALLRVSRRPSILEAHDGFYDDIERSKEAMFGCLERAVARGVAGASTVHIALSGGIDSGTIAYLMCQSGCRPEAYTLGTEWGNEYREARETADALGIELTQIHLSKEEIEAEIPTVIRFFYFVNPENIEIALVAHCLYKKLHQESPSPRLFLTGYGSDLLNAGGITACESFDALHSGIEWELGRTQLSNEFNNLAAMQYGVRVHHPFWQSEVIACALRVPPAHKLRGGQDKLYAREMMAGRLPDCTVWRKKLGAHRGSGLSLHLREAFAGFGGDRGGASSGYQSMIEAVHEDIFCRGKYA